MIKKETYNIILGVIGFIVSVTLPAMILYWVGRIAYEEITANMINFLFLSPFTMGFLYVVYCLITELVDLVFNINYVDISHRSVLINLSSALKEHNSCIARLAKRNESLKKELEDHEIRKPMTRMFR